MLVLRWAEGRAATAFQQRGCFGEASLARFGAFGTLQPVDILLAMRKRQSVETRASVWICLELRGEVGGQVDLAWRFVDLERQINDFTGFEVCLGADVAAERQVVAAPVDGDACAVREAVDGRANGRSLACA